MSPLRFRIVALIAAYALALHALLLAFAVAPAGAAPPMTELCSGLAVDQDGTLPGGHDASCAMACVMLGGNMAAPEPPAVAAVTPSRALVLRPATAPELSRSAADGSPRARAPPLA